MKVVRGTIGVPPILVNRIGKEAGLCRWFLGCGSKATKTLQHPTLGSVPVCNECHRRVTEMMR
jgi:hypothetical protein